MSTATPLIIPDKSQEAIIQFQRACYNMLNTQWNIREQMRLVDLAYIREADFTKEQQKARVSNRYGDPTKFQNVTVPIVMPQVEAAVTYQASVFLTGYPIFGWVAAPGQEDAAMMFQAITEENSIRGGWTRELMIAFRDAFKYNLAICETTWGREVTAAIETDVSFGKSGKPKEVIWEGNVIKRWDPYNSFWDTRYKPTEIYKKGEFAGTTELMSRVHLKDFINKLPDKMVQNVKAAFESGYGGTTLTGAQGIESYYLPLINPYALLQQNPLQSFDWLTWAGVLDRPPGEIAYKNLYEVTTLYARIIPQDFKLKVPSANTPQVWKFIIVNHQVLIYAERQTNAHNYLPALFLQPNEDGLAYQTKSLAANAQPFQEIGSALVNSAMAARRRAISDRGIYDPSRISEAHINSDSPTAKIPLRPAGYGKPLADAYMPIPFRDDQSQVAFQELQQIMQMANVINGQNAARQGQFVKGNKTLHEFDTVMANASGRDQTTAMMFEAQFFTPMKEIIKINTMQFQQTAQIYSVQQKQVVNVDPVALRNSFTQYKISDGLNPTDKIMSTDEFTTAIQMLATSPQLATGYNLAPAVSYLFKTRNVDLSAFEKSPAQIAYEQAAQQWQEVIMQLAKQGVDPKQYPPQPTPQQFGYNPQDQAPSGPAPKVPGQGNSPQGQTQPPQQTGQTLQLPQLS